MATYITSNVIVGWGNSNSSQTAIAMRVNPGTYASQVAQLFFRLWMTCLRFDAAFRIEIEDGEGICLYVCDAPALKFFGFTFISDESPLFFKDDYEFINGDILSLVSDQFIKVHASHNPINTPQVSAVRSFFELPGRKAVYLGTVYGPVTVNGVNSDLCLTIEQLVNNIAANEDLDDDFRSFGVSRTKEGSWNLEFGLKDDIDTPMGPLELGDHDCATLTFQLEIDPDITATTDCPEVAECLSNWCTFSSKEG